jgi:uncharacterized protein DUF1761
MNYRSLAIAAVVAWIVDSIYGFLVFGLALKSEFERYPAVFRSFDAVNSMLPLMFGASLVAMFLLAYIFAKGHEGGPGLQEGLRFGVVFGLFMFFSMSISTYVIYNIGRKLAVETACAGFVETLLMGVVLGLMYRPTPRTAARQSAGV